jgi:hypothetical protein
MAPHTAPSIQSSTKPMQQPWPLDGKNPTQRRHPAIRTQRSRSYYCSAGSCTHGTGGRKRLNG